MSDTAKDAPPPPPEETPPPPAETPSELPPAKEAGEDDRHERRWNRLTARLSTISRERDELAGRLAQLEQTAQQQSNGQQLQPEVQHYIRQEAVRLAQADRDQERTRTFHSSGHDAYADWGQRCQNLIAMGADPQIAQLLVEMPNGVKVAGELSEDPEALERIASIQTERGRAVALGQFAARLE